MRQTMARRQRGFTLTELLVVLVILGVLAALIVPQFDSSRSKATSLHKNMVEINNAFSRARADMGSFPRLPAVLWDGAQATAANMFSGLPATTTWNGRYLQAQPLDGNTGALLLSSIGQNVQVGIARDAGGLGYFYYTRANNVPNGVIRLALRECNGDETESTPFTQTRCRGIPGNGNVEFGTFDVLIDEVRS